MPRESFPIPASGPYGPRHNTKQMIPMDKTITITEKTKARLDTYREIWSYSKAKAGESDTSVSYSDVISRLLDNADTLDKEVGKRFKCVESYKRERNEPVPRGNPRHKGKEDLAGWEW